MTGSQTTGSPTGTAVRMDRQVLHEVGQVVRALEANGPRTEEELAVLVGAPYWERNRFRAALDFARDHGMVLRYSGGLLAVSS